MFHLTLSEWVRLNKLVLWLLLYSVSNGNDDEMCDNTKYEALSTYCLLCYVAEHGINVSLLSL